MFTVTKQQQRNKDQLKKSNKRKNEDFFRGNNYLFTEKKTIFNIFFCLRFLKFQKKKN